MINYIFILWTEKMPNTYFQIYKCSITSRMQKALLKSVPPPLLSWSVQGMRRCSLLSRPMEQISQEQYRHQLDNLTREDGDSVNRS